MINKQTKSFTGTSRHLKQSSWKVEASNWIIESVDDIWARWAPLLSMTRFETPRRPRYKGTARVCGWTHSISSQVSSGKHGPVFFFFLE